MSGRLTTYEWKRVRNALGEASEDLYDRLLDFDAYDAEVYIHLQEAEARLAERDAQVAVLARGLDWALQYAPDDEYRPRVASLLADIPAAARNLLVKAEEAGRLGAALETYGEHHPRCPMSPTGIVREDVARCKCGLDAALAEPPTPTEPSE